MTRKTKSQQFMDCIVADTKRELLRLSRRLEAQEQAKLQSKRIDAQCENYALLYGQAQPPPEDAEPGPA